MYIYKLLANQFRSAVDIHRFSETALFRMIKEWPPSSGNFNEWNTHNSAVAIKPWISILKSWTDLSRTTTAPLRVENSFKYAPLKRKDISIPISMSSYSGMWKKTSVTHSSKARLPPFCSYHILTTSVIYYWTDARQHGIYLWNMCTCICVCIYI